MTTKQLQAGRELDEAVAHVIGERGWPVHHIDGTAAGQGFPPYSVNGYTCTVAKQWLREQGWEVEITLFTDGRVYCRAERDGDNATAYSEGSTEPEAVARLILAVKEAAR